MAYEFIARKGLIVTGSTTISSSNATQLRVGNNFLFVSNSGNVGIGNTNPSQKLDVNGDVAIRGNLNMSDASNRYIYGINGNYINLYNGGTGGVEIYGLNGTAENKIYGGLRVTGNLITLGSFSMNGNLDIGSNNYVGAMSNGITLYRGFDASMQFFLGHPTVGDFIWNNSVGTSIMTLKRGGNLLIGTTTDSGYKLNVAGQGNFTSNLTVTGSATIQQNVVAQSFTGSLQGTATNAVSASYAPTVGYTGNIIIPTTPTPVTLVVENGLITSYF